MEVVRLRSSEDLRESVQGSDIEIVQLTAGKQQGSLTHISTGNLAITLGRFSLAVRARGILHPKRVTIGMILASKGRVLHWGEGVEPGDLIIFPPGVDADVICGGGVSYAAISMSPSSLRSLPGCEDDETDPAFWNLKGVRYTDPFIGTQVAPQLARMISNVEGSTVPSTRTADVLRRSVMDALVTSFLNILPDRGSSRCAGAHLVSEADNYMDRAAQRPIHVSELCSALKVSRRSLHRAFFDALSMGPITYLHHKRLSAIQVILKRSDPATITIVDLAKDHGFRDPGRFAGYYRSLFGETPSQTLRSAFLDRY